jgi:3-oxoacyl-[acyl-carrier protein] reductase
MAAKTLQGKVAIVTGGTRGIGEGIVKAFVEQGAYVVINYTSSEDRATNLVKQIKDNGGQAIAVRADVGDELGPKKIVDETIKAFGKIDIIVNNAGVTLMQTIDQADVESADRVYKINVRGPILLIKESTPHLREYGRIINVSSVTARLGLPGLSIYSASKAALESLSRVWAQELGPKNITSNTISPGPVTTDLFLAMPEEARADLKKSIQGAPYKDFSSVEDMVGVVLFLASPASQRITGDVLNTNGGLLFG